MDEQQRRAFQMLAPKVLDALEAIANKAHELSAECVHPDRQNYETPLEYQTSRSRVLDRERAFRNIGKEPFFARVERSSDPDASPHGRQRTRVIYFGREESPRSLKTGDGVYASYLGPMGYLAAQPPEPLVEDDDVPSVVTLSPFFDDDHHHWDARSVRVQVWDLDFGVESLRLEPPPARQIDDVSDEFERLLLEEQLSEAARQDQERARTARRQAALQASSLRDQTTLDTVQDSIFRRPINDHILLLGPPGTGKSTTLVRRLAQKSNEAHLQEEERALLAPRGLSELQAEKRWIIFTPSDLLAHYLKDPLAKWNVVVGQRNLSTWDHKRKELARDFGLVGDGLLRIRDSRARPTATTSRHTRELFEAFESQADAWFAETLKTRVRRARREVSVLPPTAVTQIETLFDGVDRLGWRGTLTRNAALLTRVAGELSDSIATEIGEELRSVFAPGLVEQVVAFYRDLEREGLHDDALRLDEEDDEEEDEEEDEDLAEQDTATGLTKPEALAKLRQAIRVRADIDAGGSKKIGKSRVKRLAAHLGESLGKPGAFRALGKKIRLAKDLRWLAGASKRRISIVSNYFGKFRRSDALSAKFYTARPTANESQYVTELELDVLLLTTLKWVAQSRAAFLNYREPEWLQTYTSKYELHVLIDEVTDFSAVQVACMFELAHPDLRSFFACGDFRQRVRAVGIDEREVSWLRDYFGGLDVEDIAIGYRQSKGLVRLAELLEPDLVVRDRWNQEVAFNAPPLLLEGASDDEAANWLLERVEEVRDAIGTMPTIGVFVANDDRGQEFVHVARARFQERGLSIVACLNGRDAGRADEVRVFSIEYIKGLEFEAVFLLDVDQYEATFGEMTERVIFLGVTRAATYLGLVSGGMLPERLASLRPALHGDGWSLAG